MMLETRPLSDALGVEVLGIDLSTPLSERQFEDIYRSWIEATVLSFRNQRLTPESQLAFARRFGSIMGYVGQDNQHPAHPELLVLSNLREGGKPIGAAVSGRYWHTDGHYFREPPSASILYALEVPRTGGDTWFANMFAAYESLPQNVKNRIDGLKVIISRIQSRPYNYPDRPPVTDEQRKAWPDIPQPMVRTHPVSGRKALYIGGNVPWRVEGMTEKDAAELVMELQQFAIQDTFTYRHRWQAGDLLVWDNRSAMHRATAYDEINQRRLMHRVTIAGDMPF
jgi:alpha-ketoglutarate-dependent taurine dioxygenase